MRLLPAPVPEPPPRYVAFVATHLDPLREEAAGVVGGADDAGQLYPEVLTDVALRWRWLELLCRRLGRPGAADSYLHRAFVRRSRRWREESAGSPDDWPAVEIRVWSPDEIWTGGPSRPRRPRRVWSSGATRIAAFVRSSTPIERAVLAEAAVAWWHAYEAHRRRRYVAAAAAVVLLIALAWRLFPVTAP